MARRGLTHQEVERMCHAVTKFVDKKALVQSPRKMDLKQN